MKTVSHRLNIEFERKRLVSIYMSVYLSVHLSINASFYLFIYNNVYVRVRVSMRGEWTKPDSDIPPLDKTSDTEWTTWTKLHFS